LIKNRRRSKAKKCDRHDLQRRYPDLDPDQIEEVCMPYRCDPNSTEISQQFGVSAETILRALRKALQAHRGAP